MKKTKGEHVYEVHPIASLFPMLSDDELSELATDIKERGLLHPIVLDKENRILDGRNRLAACKLAVVEPRFTTYEGDDPDGYALSVNIARRHLTKGQQAMVVARACLLSKQTIRSLEAAVKVSDSRISQASTVLKHAPDLADSVISGAVSLNDAYKTARERKDTSESTETKLAELRARYPELATKVVEGDLTLAGAIAEADERDAQRQSFLRAAKSNLSSVLLHLSSKANISPRRLAEDSFAEVVREFDREDIDYAVETMTAIAALAKDGV